MVFPPLWIRGRRKQLRLLLYLLREAPGELLLPEVFRPLPSVGEYHQAMVGMVHQGTCRVKNRLRGHPSVYIHCMWKEEKEQQMEWSSPSCISSTGDPGHRGLFPAAPLECKIYPSSGSSLFTQACRGKSEAGHQYGARIKLELNCEDEDKIGLFFFPVVGF